MPDAFDEMGVVGEAEETPAAVCSHVILAEQAAKAIPDEIISAYALTGSPDYLVVHDLSIVNDYMKLAHWCSDCSLAFAKIVIERLNKAKSRHVNILALIDYVLNPGRYGEKFSEDILADPFYSGIVKILKKALRKRIRFI